MKYLHRLPVIVTYSIIATAQQTKPIRITVGQPSTAPQLEREENDSVQLDAASGDIIVSSRNESFRIPPETNINANWSCDISRAASKFIYDCKLTTGPGALNQVIAFSMASEDPDSLTVRLPSGWKTFKGVDKLHPSLEFILVGGDGIDREAMAATGRTDAFRFESELMPGVVSFDLRPVPRFPKPGEKSLGERLDAISPWANAEILKLETKDRHRRRFLTVGPKIRAQVDSYAALRAELMILIGVPEYGLWQVHLSKLSQTTDPELGSLVRSLPESSPTQTALRQALLLRVESLPR
ncbi:hypothetical protein [Bryobacter aggregatus]|uniref:hypothetical protein n=1 Tax=Bryobacter aggregatus TaxID=360054 RepID=UPI0004E22A12|nr:hypothetical protein [Bryobacter aggregatus]